MIVEWLNPAAFAGLAAIAGPLIVHLLWRRRAVRVAFPSVRFIAGASTAAVRPRRPSDGLLLLLRLTIITAAITALAAPVVVTPWKQATWDSRLSRAVVVDASGSMRDATARASEAAAAARQGATHAVGIEAPDLREGVGRAVTTLRSSPPGRREIVIVSDLHAGAISAADLDGVPPSYGLRFVDVGRLPRSRTIRGPATLGAGPVVGRAQSIELAGPGTEVRLVPAAPSVQGLRIEHGRGRSDELLRLVALAGAPAPAADQPIAFTFAPVPIAGRVSAWMAGAILAMRTDERLLAAAREHRAPQAAPPAPGAPWITVGRAAAGEPVVLAGAHEGELTIFVRANPEDFLAAAALRAVLLARRGIGEWTEQEIERIPAATLAAWTRAPQPFVPSRDQLRIHDESDSRLLWVLVLLWMLLERVVRRRSPQRPRQQYADAA